MWAVSRLHCPVGMIQRETIPDTFKPCRPRNAHLHGHEWVSAFLGSPAAWTKVVRRCWKPWTDITTWIGMDSPRQGTDRDAAQTAAFSMYSAEIRFVATYSRPLVWMIGHRRTAISQTLNN